MPTTAPPPEGVEDLALFDKKRYELLPKENHRTATKLTLAFGGSVEVDLYDIEQITHYADQGLGDEITLTIHGTIGGVNWSHKETDESTDTKHKLTVKVHSYDLPDGDD